MNVKESYIPSLPFTVNGYLFKCENNASYDILYIFPECRNKQKNDEEKKVQKKVDDVESPKIVEKNEATFLTKMTEYLDVYEIFIFDKTKGKKARIGYAGIPDIKTSVMMKEWFKTVEDEIYVKYRKHPVNDKWIPQFLVKEEC